MSNTDIFCLVLAVGQAFAHVHLIIFWGYKPAKVKTPLMQFSIVDLSAGVISVAIMQGLASLIEQTTKLLFLTASFTVLVWCLGVVHLRTFGVNDPGTRWFYLGILNPALYVYATFTAFLLTFFFRNVHVGESVGIFFAWLFINALISCVALSFVFMVFRDEAKSRDTA